MTLVLRAASRDDCDALSDVVFRSKQSNGYDTAFMEACRQELTISPDRLKTLTLWMAEDDGKHLGCAGLRRLDDGTAEIELFFVDPTVQGRGVGRMLWTLVFKEAHENGVSDLYLEADPASVQFYAKLGFKEIGASPSGSIPDRFLPRMHLSL